MLNDKKMYEINTHTFQEWTTKIYINLIYTHFKNELSKLHKINTTVSDKLTPKLGRLRGNIELEAKKDV